MFTAEILKTHPEKSRVESSALVECISACLACEQACVSCADACLGEKMVEQLRACIRLNQDCADLCASTTRALSRFGGADFDLIRGQVQLLALACRKCGDECDRHADMHEHCRICAQACRSCQRACNRLLEAAVH